MYSFVRFLNEFLREITIKIDRLTLPNDANIYGNVHGGVTLKMIEEAGIILSTRFCNHANKVTIYLSEYQANISDFK